MRKRSSLSVASRDSVTALRAPTVASAASTVMIAITMTSSMSVQPPRPRRARLPVDILRAVEGGTVAPGVDVVNVLAAPAGGIRIVLIGAHAPLLCVRHRVHRDAAQELQLPSAGVAVGPDALDQDLELRRIPFRARLQLGRRDLLQIGGVLVAIDGGPDF